jgi:hypothetical protein
VRIGSDVVGIVEVNKVGLEDRGVDRDGDEEEGEVEKERSSGSGSDNGDRLYGDLRTGLGHYSL